MKELNLKLSITELNLILEALGHQPYIRVYELIDHIQNQAKEQLNGAASPLGRNPAATSTPTAANLELSTL
jgi:hypothetical protein